MTGAIQAGGFSQHSFNIGDQFSKDFQALIENDLIDTKHQRLFNDINHVIKSFNNSNDVPHKANLLVELMHLTEKMAEHFEEFIAENAGSDSRRSKRRDVFEILNTGKLEGRISNLRDTNQSVSFEQVGKKAVMKCSFSEMIKMMELDKETIIEMLTKLLKDGVDNPHELAIIIKLFGMVQSSLPFQFKQDVLDAIKDFMQEMKASLPPEELKIVVQAVKEILENFDSGHSDQGQPSTQDFFPSIEQINIDTIDIDSLGSAVTDVSAAATTDFLADMETVSVQSDVGALVQAANRKSINQKNNDNVNPTQLLTDEERKQEEHEITQIEELLSSTMNEYFQQETDKATEVIQTILESKLPDLE